ncbi:hypothetical protein FOZ61_001072 [Perkinsus olseni]|uniref:Uncharacterized protein n=1 Tax=Perkinsus olseni TaxID=32597 RepID=A0A7J6LZA8_PEROL|nr:hypothetical protein FOZ61_001072 [Perkinsus olseni]
MRSEPVIIPSAAMVAVFVQSPVRVLALRTPEPAIAMPETSVALLGGRAADIGFIVFIILITLSAVVAFGGFNMKPLFFGRHDSHRVALEKGAKSERTERVGRKRSSHRTPRGNAKNDRSAPIGKREEKPDRGEEDVQFSIVHDVRPSSEEGSYMGIVADTPMGSFGMFRKQGEVDNLSCSSGVTNVADGRSYGEFLAAPTEALNELLRVTGVHVQGDSGKGIWTAVTRRSGLRLSAAMGEGGVAEALAVYLRVSNYARIELVTAVDEKARKTLVKSIIRLLKGQKQVVHLEAVARTAEEKSFWTTEIGFHVSDAAADAQKSEGVLLLETFVQTMTKAERREYNRAREVALPLAAGWWRWGPVEARRPAPPSPVVAKPPLMPPLELPPWGTSASVDHTEPGEDSVEGKKPATEDEIYGPAYGDDDDDDDDDEDEDSDFVPGSWIPSLRGGDEEPLGEEPQREWSGHDVSTIGREEEVSSIGKDVGEIDTLSTLRSPNCSRETDESTAEPARLVPKLKLPLPKDRSAAMSPPASSIDINDTGSSEACQDSPVKWIPKIRSPDSSIGLPPGESAGSGSPTSMDESPEVLGDARLAPTGDGAPAEVAGAGVVGQEAEAALSWRPSLFAGRSATSDASVSVYQETPSVNDPGEVEAQVDEKMESRESSSSTGTEPSRERMTTKKGLKMSTSFDWAEESGDDEDLINVGLADIPSYAETNGPLRIVEKDSSPLYGQEPGAVPMEETAADGSGKSRRSGRRGNRNRRNSLPQKAAMAGVHADDDATGRSARSL